MEAKELHKRSGKNLLDEIAADPDIINRKSDKPMPILAATPIQNDPDSPPPVVWNGVGAASGKAKPAPLMDLLHPADQVAGTGAPVSAAPSGGATVGNVPPRRKTGKFVAIALVAGFLVAGAGGYLIYRQQSAGIQVAASPSPIHLTSPTPAPSVTPTPPPIPTDSPTPLPTPTPVPDVVTAPVAAPSTDHPQAVTVKTPSGLWLRSSPDSSNKSNIIGWIPNNAQVSVDATGVFWWHGIYAGKTGYFAVNYTK